MNKYKYGNDQFNIIFFLDPSSAALCCVYIIKLNAVQK